MSGKLAKNQVEANEFYGRRARRLGYQNELKMWKDLYEEKGWGLTAIAGVVGRSPGSVSRRMIALGVYRPKRRMDSGPAYRARSRWQQLAERHGFSDEKEMLETLYRDQSTRSIAVLLGVNQQTVQDHLKRNGIKLRPQGGRRTPQALEQYRLAWEHEDFEEWRESFGDYNPVDKL